MRTTPLSQGTCPNKGAPFLGMWTFGHLAASKVVPARPRQQLVNAGRHSAAASARGGAFRLVLPLNSATHTDARASRVLCKGYRARAGGRER
jgi:hypothetical protein